ncbi:MAG: DUF4349 domain-containing protein [Brumimicrobium sp.]
MRLSLFILLLLLLSCQEAENSDSVVDSDSELSAKSFTEKAQDKIGSEQNNDEESNKNSNAIVNRKLIKEGEISFETDDVDKTKFEIKKLLSKHNAYIGNENIDKGYTRISHHLTIRIPSENFDVFLDDVTGLPNGLESKVINVKDVTEEFIDIQARIKTKKAVEARYEKLLDKAGSIEEILKVENQIGNLRTEIESMEGRLRLLKNRVGLSTLKIDYYQTIESKEASPNSFAKMFSDGLSDGWKVIQYIIIGLAHLWSILTLLIIGYFTYRFFKKRNKAK